MLGKVMEKWFWVRDLDFTGHLSTTIKFQTSGTLPTTLPASWLRTEAAKTWWTIRLFPVTSSPDSFSSAMSRLVTWWLLIEIKLWSSSGGPSGQFKCPGSFGPWLLEVKKSSVFTNTSNLCWNYCLRKILKVWRPTMGRGGNQQGLLQV